MSRGHGSSRRQAYGRRMKDLRTRRGARRRTSTSTDRPTGTAARPGTPNPAIHRSLDVHVDPSRRGAPPR